MENDLDKYFANELTPEEKDEFLLKVNNDDELQEDFIENQQLLALVDWLSPASDEELARQKLAEFMSRMRMVENK